MKPKPLLSRVKSENLPEDIRAAWDKSMSLRGDGTFFEVFAKHPELYRWYIEEFYGKVFQLGKVKNRYKQLLRLKLSTLHGCKFCNQGNRNDALESGLSQDQIENFENQNLDVFSKADLAVMDLAERLSMSNPNGTLDPSLYSRLREHFCDAEIIELGFVGSILTGVAKFLFAFDLVEKEEYCPFK